MSFPKPAFVSRFSRIAQIIAAMVCCASSFGQDAATKPGGGLSLRFSDAANHADVAVSPNVWLYVPSGQSPSPFLPAGAFKAVWTGFISADLRSDFSFQAELNGTLKLEINGATALEVTGTNSTSALSPAVRLNKGTNAFVATFQSPAQGDAFLRLQWKPKDSFPHPIPLSVLTHWTTPEEEAGMNLRLGRELFVESRCAKCHVGPESGMPELGMDAPSFEGIGSRRNADWMAKWITDPQSLRPSAHMPKLFSGESARVNAEAIAAYLTSLVAGAIAPSTEKADPARVESGKALFASLHCTACHDAPDASDAVATKVSLKQVGAKFPGGIAGRFLEAT